VFGSIRAQRGDVRIAFPLAAHGYCLKHIERNLEVELRGVGQCLNLKHPNLIDLYDIRYDDHGDAWYFDVTYESHASMIVTIEVTQVSKTANT
jgi:hypothetical protein